MMFWILSTHPVDTVLISLGEILCPGHLLVYKLEQFCNDDAQNNPLPVVRGQAFLSSFPELLARG